MAASKMAREACQLRRYENAESLRLPYSTAFFFLETYSFLTEHAVFYVTGHRCYDVSNLIKRRRSA